MKKRDQMPEKSSGGADREKMTEYILEAIKSANDLELKKIMLLVSVIIDR